ncbi:MAG: DUF1501 domain-containing protein [Planctomycetales bacterium]
MLDVLIQQQRDRRGVTRREFLRAGYLGLGGLTLADLFRLRATAAAAHTGIATRNDSAVIMLYLRGGASHFETYDMKPLATDVIRGPFKPIATTVPGIEVCEHLPEHARRADRYTLIRSCVHEESEHTQGIARTLTGYGESNVPGNRPISPEIGAVVTRVFSEERRAMPPAIIMGANYFGYITGAWNGYWPLAYRPPMLKNGQMENVAPLLDGRRVDDRLGLLASLDEYRRELDVAGNMDAMDRFNRQAVDIITGNAARAAFDLSLEDEATRQRYGKGWGQQALLARRLVEAGVSFVTVSVPGAGPKKVSTNWDDHAGNWDIGAAMLDRLPDFDRVVGALVDDIYSRGLYERVMLVVMGEFGRTPRMNKKNGNWGRDHWPGAGSLLITGGGVRTGQVIGATNKNGEFPTERPVDPHDVLATIYRHLGIDHKHEFPDASGRPVPITRGEPIAELF